MIVLRTKDPKALLQAIYDAIDKANGKSGIKTKERVITWGYDEDKYFHHDPDTSNDWASKARFRPLFYTEKGILAFFIKNHKGTKGSIDHPVYAIYHGRFLGMLIAHSPDLFTIENVTNRPFTGDWEVYYSGIY